ncbi:MAG TPA: hypothetical protein VGS27_33635 [Candidatus Sulfotelmatobacter sp.]|nr:hypothetical protein [Candidatus Sulfotelmatobacter sp.]
MCIRSRAVPVSVLSLFLLCVAGCGGGKAPNSEPASPPSNEQLTVTAPSAGSGTVTSTPKGINCPTTCTANFAQGTKVQLSAKPGSNYFFEGWSGACSGDAACTVTMSGAESVGATFTAGETLSVSVGGNGTGKVTSTPAGITCPTTCTATFPQGTQVTLTASADLNAVFSSWSGACTGSADCSVTLSGSDSVAANFNTSTAGGDGTAAFVYVSSAVSGGNQSQIEAYAADSNGELTPVGGSPFAVNMVSLAVNGNFLFGSDGTNLFSYAVGSDGSITQSDSMDVKQYNNPENCSGGPSYLFLDRTGSTLYNLDYLSDCANNSYQASGVDASSGKLSYRGMTEASSPVFERIPSFTGDDQYAVGASCYHNIPEVYVLKRNGDGTLTLVTKLGSVAQLPSGGSYCTWWASGDGMNHFAVSVTPIDGASGQQSGNPQLAVYTVDGTGHATTTSTSANMRAITGNVVNDLGVSPAGNFVAVGEDYGLQIFSFNGANPIGGGSGLLTTDPIDEVRWDNQNHVYALSMSTGKLYVFVVSSSGTTAAAGSPYTIQGAGYLAVLPKS